MPDFDPVNSIYAHCEADDLKHGQLVWAVMIEEDSDKLSVVPCRVLQRHDSREDYGWHIMYDLACPEIKGLTVKWQILWTDTKILFQDKENALIAAEAWMREKLKEDADFMERVTMDDMSWEPQPAVACCDPNDGAYNGD